MTSTARLRDCLIIKNVLIQFYWEFDMTIIWEIFINLEQIKSQFLLIYKQYIFFNDLD